MVKNIGVSRKEKNKTLPSKGKTAILPLMYLNFFKDNTSMKVGVSLKADPSKGDKIVKRRGRLYIINKKDPNRKKRQKGPARKK